MTEPVFTPATEDTYASLAGYLRAADRQQADWPLKRFLSATTDIFGVVTDAYQRIDYLSPDEYGADRRPVELYENLAPNPSFEDITPLPDPAAVVNCTTTRIDTVSTLRDGGSWAYELASVAAGAFRAQLLPGAPVELPDSPDSLLTVSADYYGVPGRVVHVVVDCYDGAGGSLGQATGDVTYHGPGFERLSVTVVMPLGTAQIGVSAGTTATGADEQLVVDTILVTPGGSDRPYARYGGTVTGETSALVTPEIADDAWLPWLAQLVGVKLNLNLSRQAKVDAIRYASAGWQGGTKSAVAAAAKSVLTGTRYVKVFDHSTDAGVGTGGEWDVLLVTRATETPDPSAVLAAVVAQNAKPAGVTLYHLSYNATWAQIQTSYPTWADWQAAGTWANIEEAGLA